MVKITNGVNVFEVTKGAFDGIYSHQGYALLEEETSTKEAPSEEMSADEKFLLEIKEKPISQWSKSEVKRFAALNEVSLAGTQNVNEAKDIIKDFIENESQE